MKTTARILLAAACFVLAIGFVIDRASHRSVPASAAAQALQAPLTPFCARVWPQLDSLWTHDRRASKEENARQQGAALEFYSLCLIDSKLGTTEAESFLNEENDRAHRILAAMKAMQERKR